MLKYLIVQLDDTSVSFCHYRNYNTIPRLIPLDRLKKAFLWSMKENLTVQILYPSYRLPDEYTETISHIDHADIVPAICSDDILRQQAHVVVFDTWNNLCKYELCETQTYVIRTTFTELTANIQTIKNILPRITRLNVTLTDIPQMDKDDLKAYDSLLADVSSSVKAEFAAGHAVQLNILTDRIMLEAMNNCNAGDESLTVAPDGKLYVCPAFYLDGAENYAAGDIASGPDVRNRQLYSLTHAPICRECDAWQCRRCVWLNLRLTREINTPGRQQCVAAHIERNAARRLMADIRSAGQFMPHRDIPKIDYLDPFDKITIR